MPEIRTLIKLQLTYLMLICGIWFISIEANADAISDRKAKFKANATSMKAIRAALSDNDFDTVVKHGTSIANWASEMSDYFPEGSNYGDTKARAEIWINFSQFKIYAEENQKAANHLVAVARSRDLEASLIGVKSLGTSCKSCHNSFKD